MKTLATVILLSISINLAAQPPMGGGGGGRPPGGPGGGRPPMHSMNQQEDNFIITGLPDIQDLSLKQREQLSKALSDERKDVSKLMKEKQELEREAQNPGLASKDRVKMMEKAEKTDDKIRKKEEKYDKKIRKILSDEQYLQFKEKKNEIRFLDQRRPNGQRQRPDSKDRQDRPMTPPDEPMGGMGEDMF